MGKVYCSKCRWFRGKAVPGSKGLAHVACTYRENMLSWYEPGLSPINCITTSTGMNAWKKHPSEINYSNKCMWFEPERRD